MPSQNQSEIIEHSFLFLLINIVRIEKDDGFYEQNSVKTKVTSGQTTEYSFIR